MQQNFEEAKAEIMWQQIAYKVCDECKVDSLECGSRYGNRRKCRILIEELDKIYAYDCGVTGEENGSGSL